jgi:hypothetical protein
MELQKRTICIYVNLYVQAASFMFTIRMHIVYTVAPSDESPPDSPWLLQKYFIHSCHSFISTNLYTNLCLKHGNGTETLHCKSLFLMDDAFTCFYIVSENSMPNHLFDVIYSKHQYHLTKKWLLGGKTTRGQLGNAHSDVWMVHHGKENATAECHRPVRIQQLMFQRNWCLFSK